MSCGVLPPAPTKANAREIVDCHARRLTIEPGFRDAKNLLFAMGMSALRISDPQRRDRLPLLSAPAIVLLTLLGPLQPFGKPAIDRRDPIRQRD